MKHSGAAGSAVLLIAVFFVASANSLPNNCKRQNGVSVRTYANGSLTDVETEEAFKLVRVILGQYDLRHKDLNLALKQLDNIEKHPFLCNEDFDTEYVVQGLFSRDNGGDLKCKMNIYIGHPVNVIESILDCDVLRTYSIDVTLTNVSVREELPDEV